jgi:hypothetical protein
MAALHLPFLPCALMSTSPSSENWLEEENDANRNELDKTAFHPSGTLGRDCDHRHSQRDAVAQSDLETTCLA